MKLSNSIFLVVALFISTQVSAFEVKEAVCPKKYNDLEKQFWTKLISEATVGILDKLESINIKCGILNPPLEVKELKNLAMISVVFTQYPVVVIPWTTYGEGGVYIVRGRITEDKQIEFVKMMYYTNGNLVISTVLISVNTGRINDPT